MVEKPPEEKSAAVSLMPVVAPTEVTLWTLVRRVKRFEAGRDILRAGAGERWDEGVAVLALRS